MWPSPHRQHTSFCWYNRLKLKRRESSGGPGGGSELRPPLLRSGLGIIKGLVMGSQRGLSTLDGCKAPCSRPGNGRNTWLPPSTLVLLAQLVHWSPLKQVELRAHCGLVALVAGALTLMCVHLMQWKLKDGPFCCHHADLRGVAVVHIARG